jgi:hypothetical protein
MLMGRLPSALGRFYNPFAGVSHYLYNRLYKNFDILTIGDMSIGQLWE